MISRRALLGLFAVSPLTGVLKTLPIEPAKLPVDLVVGAGERLIGNADGWKLFAMDGSIRQQGAHCVFNSITMLENSFVRPFALETIGVNLDFTPMMKGLDDDHT